MNRFYRRKARGAEGGIRSEREANHNGCGAATLSVPSDTPA